MASENRPDTQVEVIPVTRKSFPQEPILLASDRYRPGLMRVKPGDLVFFKIQGGKDCCLKNAHWFRSLTFEVIGRGASG